MTPKPATVLIIGLGRIAIGYDLDAPTGMIFTHARACQAHGDAKLVAGVDVSVEARARFSAHTGAPAFATIAEAIARVDRPDIAILATPVSDRLELVKELVVSRPRLLLVEKPLARTVEEGKQIVDLCREANISLAVNYIRRFDPLIGRWPISGDAANLGTLRGFHIQFTGGLLENGSHYIDLLFAWFGKSTHARRISERVCEITVAGVIGSLEERSLDYGLGEMDVFLQHGRVRLLDYGERYEISRVGPDPLFSSHRRLLRSSGPLPDTGMHRYQFHVIDQLIAHVKSGAPLASTGETALDVLACCEQLDHV